MAFMKSKQRATNQARAATVSDETLKKLGIDRARLQTITDQFQGTLVFPGDPSYDQDRQESNPAFQEYPEVIAYCAVWGDVDLCLQWAQEGNLWVTCRSGGHSTAGYSVNSGMVIDVSRFSYVIVDTSTNTAKVGAGTSFGTLNAQLEPFGLHVPGGGCGSVCVAGYMQGGGFGFTSREFGMNCDNVIGATLMLADRHIVEVSPALNEPLYWAIRGGTGDNFGVLLEVEYQLHPLGNLWGFGILWNDMRDAPAALKMMQDQYTTSGAPSTIGYMTIITGQPPAAGNPPVLMMRGMFDGPRDQGLQLLKPLLSIGSAQLQIDMVGSYTTLNTYLLEKPYDIPVLPDGAKEDKQAGYVAAPLSLSQWQQVIDYYMSSPHTYNTIVIEPYGGAINTYPVEDSAFIHRAVMFDFFVDVFWVQDSDKAAAVNWLNGFMDLMQPWFNGHVYQNYPRRTLTNYRWMYWGNAFNTLLAVKEAYDPTKVFRFEQCIQRIPTPSAPGITRDTSAPRWPAPTIVRAPYSRAARQ